MEFHILSYANLFKTVSEMRKALNSMRFLILIAFPCIISEKPLINNLIKNKKTFMNQEDP